MQPRRAKTEREAKLIRLGQLQDALLRDARFIVCIRMHTGVGGALSIDAGGAVLRHGRLSVARDCDDGDQARNL